MDKVKKNKGLEIKRGILGPVSGDIKFLKVTESGIITISKAYLTNVKRPNQYK
jgi:hypothetical protein